MKFSIGKEFITIKKIHSILCGDYEVSISREAQKKVTQSRKYLDKKIKKGDKIYGVNTGFGSFCNISVNKDELVKLQENLVLSHACGMGMEVPPEIVKLMLLLKANALSIGNSGVQLKTIQKIIQLYNLDITPVVYQQGSLGASGDLAPLAHLVLPLISKCDVNYKDKKRSTTSLFKKFKIDRLSLQPKEGLALLNGTQFMTSYGVNCLLKSYKLSYLSDIIASISLDAFKCRKEPFNEQVHLARPHNGQIKTAARIREILQDSDSFNIAEEYLQDPYSFRCIPQVHGATKDVIEHVRKILEIEINSSSDNPLIFTDTDEIISAGNFHGQPLALCLDYLAIAMAELGSISERRIFKLISGERGLPEFLIKKSGLNSGFMIPQYTAASIVSQNKQLCTPSSVDSITSSNGQEDHVSMGANAATKAYTVINNVEKVLSLELLVSAQALDIRGVENSSSFIQSILNRYRSDVPFIKSDRLMEKLIQKSQQFIKSMDIDESLLFE